MGAVLLAVGWRLRRRPGVDGDGTYGVILQGAGIGVFYLTALGALRLHPLLTPALAFAFMAGVAALGALLAVLQDAPWLAYVSVPRASPRRCWSPPAAPALCPAVRLSRDPGRRHPRQSPGSGPGAR